MNTALPMHPIEVDSRATKYLQAILFIGSWMGIGFVFKPDPNLYLLIGIPLTYAFQRWVRRRPTRELWVREGITFRFGKLGYALAIALLIVPIQDFMHMLAHHYWIGGAWDVAAISGAIVAAFCLRQFTRVTTRSFFLCLASAGSIGVVIMIGAALTRTFVLHQPLHFHALAGAKSLLLYFPVSFLIEEVTFRGCIDSHVHGQISQRNTFSMFFVSAVWGLWHLPLVASNVKGALTAAIPILVIHTLIGVPFSIYWRKSGNLAVPGFTHAFIDAIRNAMM